MRHIPPSQQQPNGTFPDTCETTGGYLPSCNWKFGDSSRLVKRSILTLLLLAALPAFGADKKPAAARLFFSATVHGSPVSIFIADRSFDPTRHKTTQLSGEGSTFKPATIDGRVPVGTDQTLPHAGVRQLSQLYVQFGAKRIDVPERLLTHVFIPHRGPATFDHRYAASLVSVSADGRAVLISLGVGDGGGTGTYSLYVAADGTCTNKEPQRPQP